VNEITLAIIGDDGSILLDDTDKSLSADMQRDLAGLLGEPEGTACANPNTELLQLPATNAEHGVRIGGYYHGSMIDGPGLRSVARLQGCPIHCPGCYVPQTWDFGAGTLVNVDELADALLDPEHERDGVTIIGGEPFAQPQALACLVGELRGQQPDLDICIYSGFTLESLRRRSNPDIDLVLDTINTLIDGRYIQALAASAGPYTGSGNQRVLDMREHRSVQ
jgi:anaerobic ribonucleoside-triphosphate reductase activating protein